MADMTVNEIYQLLAKKLENDINTYSKVTKFTVKTSYNYQEPSKELSTINGVMNFSTNNVAPIENLEVYTLPAIVSFYCEKSYANEVMAILTKYIADIRGLIQPVGEYFTVPTYSTPSQSEISMVGQVGESIKITMYIEYTVYKELLFTNDVIAKIDNVQLLIDEIAISKQKSCENDNVENQETLETIPLAQDITFECNGFISPNTQFLLDEMLSLTGLKKQHSLTLTISGKTYPYTVVLSHGVSKGKVGGAMYYSLTFSVADGAKGGA